MDNFFSFNKKKESRKVSWGNTKYFQIANYGIGGHYDPHFDHARKEESKSFESLGTGNRIATVLFYVIPLNFIDSICFFR